VHLALVDENDRRAREIWSGAGGTLKASFSLNASVAADTFGWTLEPPLITRIDGTARPGARQKSADA
jgi:hypothetical protein